MNLYSKNKEELIELIKQLDEENQELTNQYNELAWIVETQEDAIKSSVTLTKQLASAVEDAESSKMVLQRIVAEIVKVSKYTNQIKEPSDINKLMKHIKAKFKRW